MNRRMMFTIFCLLFVANFAHCACLNQLTIRAASSDLICVNPNSIDELNRFPQIDDVAYKSCDDPTKGQYLTSLHNFNNACMAKVITAIRDEQAQCVTNRFNFVIFVNDKSLQKKIADAAKVDEFHVQLYISRSIAAHINRCESPLQKLQMLTSFKNFWSEDQRYILFSVLQIEDMFLCGLLSIKEFFSKFLFYDAQKKDFFGVPGNPVIRELAKRIETEHLPFTMGFLTKQRHIATGAWTGRKLDDPACIKVSDYQKAGSSLMKFMAEIERLSKDSDAGQRTLGFSCYYQLYSKLFLQQASSLLESLLEFYAKLADLNNWHINEKKFQAKQIADLIASLDGKNRFDIIFELFLDYHQLSILDSSMTAILSEISNVVKFISLDGHQLNGPIDLVEETKFLKERTEHMRSTVLPRLNSFLEECVTMSIPFGVLFVDEMKKYKGRPVHPIFHFPNLYIQNEYVSTAFINNESMQEQQKRERDLMTVDALMKTYFNNEGHCQQHANAESIDKRSKKIKKHREGCSTKKLMICSTAHEDLQDSIESKPAQAKGSSPTSAPIILRYHHRVLRWFNPQFTQRCEQESVIYHTLPPFIDTYLEKEGFQDHWNGNRRFSLPAKITRQDGSFAHVICSCTITKDGQIYHRGFDFSSIDQIREKFGIHISEVKSVAIDAAKEDPFILVFRNKRIQNRSLLFDDNKEFVMLYDPINKLYVQLFHRT